MKKMVSQSCFISIEMSELLKEGNPFRGITAGTLGAS